MPCCFVSLKGLAHSRGNHFAKFIFSVIVDNCTSLETIHVMFTMEILCRKSSRFCLYWVFFFSERNVSKTVGIEFHKLTFWSTEQTESENDVGLIKFMSEIRTKMCHFCDFCDFWMDRWRG